MAKNEKPRGGKKAETFGVADSIKHAIGILRLRGVECSEGLLRRAKKAGCPHFKSNRVYLDGLVPWIKEHADELDDSNDKDALECRRLVAQCEKLEFELAVTRGEYIHKDDFERDAIRVADLFRIELLAFHADQVTWEGLPAVERDSRGKARVRLSMENLKRVLAA